MSGETYVTYGEVVIRNCHTQSITQTPVMDQSGTNLVCWKFTVKVSGIVHGISSWCRWVTPTAGSNVILGNGPTAGQSYNSSVKAMIGTRVGLPPRQEFAMTVGYSTNPEAGEIILQASPIVVKPAALTNKDVRNGPFCTEFVVNKISGGDIFHVTATFEVHKVECHADLEKAIPPGQAEGNTLGVLSNRWTCTDTLDQNRRLSRQYVGTLVVASNIYNPNMFRYLTVPPLQPRMKRENMQFTVTDDGLQLQYSFTDVQISQAPPHPCSHWELTVTTSANLERIIKREVSGVLVCPDDAGNAADLLALAWYIIAAKIHNKQWNDNAIKKNSAILESISHVEHIGERTALSFSAVFQVVQTQQPGQGGNNEFYQNLVGYAGVPLSSDLLPANAANYNPYLSSGGRYSAENASGVETPYIQGPVPLASAFLPYLQSPCDDNHSMIPAPEDGVQTDTNGNPVSGPVSSVPVYTSPTLPEEDTSYFTDAAKTYAYTAWKMSSTIQSRTMRAAMPIAKQQSSSTPEDTTKFIKLSGTQARRVVRIHAERVGQWPEMPDLENLPGFSSSDAGAGYAGPTQKLLKSRNLYSLPEIAATGQQYYTVGIEAVYGLSRAPLPAEQIPVGNHIWNTTGNITTNINATKAPSWPTS